MRTVTRMFAMMIVVSGMVSCLSGPAPSGKAPEWILKTPEPDAKYTYFVASSSDSDGDASRATQAAADQLLSQITRYMGVEVKVDTTALAKGSLDSYSSAVSATVTQSGSSMVSGFSVKERYAVREHNGVTVYILAQYITRDLETEKARIQAVFKEKEDAVLLPEMQGDAFVKAGKIFDAVTSYIDAMAAAAGAAVDNADIKLERNANKARAQLAKLRFVTLDAPVLVGLAKTFPKPFSAKLVYGETEPAIGIKGADVHVTYQHILQSSGRITSKTERVTTNAEGIASFTPPPPDFVGKATLTFSLNFNAIRERLDAMPRKHAPAIEALQADLSGRSIAFVYTVVSSAKTVPTGIAVIDLHADGSIASTVLAQAGLFETLARQKYKVGLAPISTASLASLNDAAVLKEAKRQYGGSLSRYIYGTACVTDVKKDGAMWQATAIMTLRCVDFASGEILYAGEKTTIVMADTESAAAREALRKVGREIMAKDLMANIP